MGRIVIVAYRPKPGKAEALKELTKMHVPRLKQEGLVTGREPNNALLPEGAYYYIIDLKNNIPKISGWVLIVR